VMRGHVQRCAEETPCKCQPMSAWLLVQLSLVLLAQALAGATVALIARHQNSTTQVVLPHKGHYS
jgi:hypothetical protein